MSEQGGKALIPRSMSSRTRPTAAGTAIAARATGRKLARSTERSTWIGPSLWAR
jgi:hypothetical protein